MKTTDYIIVIILSALALLTIENTVAIDTLNNQLKETKNEIILLKENRYE